MMRTLTPFLSLIIAILLFVFVTKPEFVKVQDIKVETEKYKNATEKYKEFTETLEEKRGVMASHTREQKSRIDRIVPTEVDDTRLLVDLEQMAKKEGLLFGNITVESGGSLVRKTEEESGVKNAELGTVDISFEVIGTYAQFKKFLTNLESSLTLFEMTNMSFTVLEESLFQQFSLTVRVHTIPE